MTPTHRYNGIKKQEDDIYNIFSKGKVHTEIRLENRRVFSPVRRRIKIISVRRLPGVERIITLLQENMIIQIMKFMR